MGDNGSRSDHGTVTDPNAGQYGSLVTDPHVVAYDNVSLAVPGFGNPRPVALPLLVEERKGVGGKRPQRVVGTVEKEFCSAGNRTETPDDEPLVVDGIMVENIVGGEKARVGSEIVMIV